MAIAQRGQIVSRNRARQIRDFSGLLFGNITPTDIDGLIEYHGKAYIFIETKLGNASLPNGQRLALERLADDLTKVKPTLLIVAMHNAINPDDDIDVATAIVAEYRFKGHKREGHSETTVKDLIIKFLETVDKR